MNLANNLRMTLEDGGHEGDELRVREAFDGCLWIEVLQEGVNFNLLVNGADFMLVW